MNESNGASNLRVIEPKVPSFLFETIQNVYICLGFLHTGLFHAFHSCKVVSACLEPTPQEWRIFERHGANDTTTHIVKKY